jgi:hypothetical protein
MTDYDALLRFSAEKAVIRPMEHDAATKYLFSLFCDSCKGWRWAKH